MNGRLLDAISRFLKSLPDGTPSQKVVSSLPNLRSSIPFYSTWQILFGFVGFAVIFGYFNHSDWGGPPIIAISQLPNL